MKLGFLSDAHGNEPGFSCCFKYLSEHCDKIFFLGDAVGYFPLSNSLLDRLREPGISCLKGNHDAMLLGELPYDPKKEPVLQLEKSRAAITEINRAFLRGLPSRLEWTTGHIKLLLLHGGPSDPLNQYIYPDSDLSVFDDLGYDAIFMGHTHRAFQKTTRNKTIVNVGSCGFSRDHGNKLTVVVYDTDHHSAEIHEFRQEPGDIIKLYGDRLHPLVTDILMRNPKQFANA